MQTSWPLCLSLKSNRSINTRTDATRGKRNASTKKADNPKHTIPISNHEGCDSGVAVAPPVGGQWVCPTIGDEHPSTQRESTLSTPFCDGGDGNRSQSNNHQRSPR
mmetsp:Transcript_34044/g.70787  ORF Transcript_34044/g.70787 Transcript_34044/m.70787 type:complete len:106 (-) Transcript_34044:931-1248(-)